MSQPPGNGSTSHRPKVGNSCRPGATLRGSAIRLCGGSESTAATQPSGSTASAGLPIRARIGAATVRRLFRIRLCCSRRCDSASRATASTSATVVGCTVAAGPETSTTPMTWPGPRILDRRARARPRMVAAGVVLRGEHLHGTVRHQRGSDGVGADRVLTPVRALDEPEPVGRAEHPRRAGAPQHPSGGVGDDEDVVALGDQRFQPAREFVEHGHQARGPPQFLERVVGDLGRRHSRRDRRRAPSTCATNPR